MGAGPRGIILLTRMHFPCPGHFYSYYHLGIVTCHLHWMISQGKKSMSRIGARQREAVVSGSAVAVVAPEQRTCPRLPCGPLKPSVGRLDRCHRLHLHLVSKVTHSGRHGALVPVKGFFPSSIAFAHH